MTTNSPTWLEEAKERLARALCTVFGLEWESDEALEFMRYAYMDDAPQPPRTQDVLYIDAVVLDDATTSAIDTTFSDKARVRETIALNCPLVFYGPHSTVNAQRAKTVLMIDTGPGCPRDILRQGNMVIEWMPPAPTSTREQDEDMWRQRADLNVRINLLHTVELDFSPIEGMPEVITSARPY